MNMNKRKTRMYLITSFLFLFFMVFTHLLSNYLFDELIWILRANQLIIICAAGMIISHSSYLYHKQWN